MEPDADLAAAGRLVGDPNRARILQRGWVRRQEGSRIVTVTPAGCAGLDAWLGIDLGRLRAGAAA
jgi:hypothetical protein